MLHFYHIATCFCFSLCQGAWVRAQHVPDDDRLAGLWASGPSEDAADVAGDLEEGLSKPNKGVGGLCIHIHVYVYVYVKP